MDIARKLDGGELVEAEELWALDVVDKDAYTCRGCSVKVFPASYDKDRNKRRPYFSLGKIGRHQTDCDIDGEDKLVSRARKERVGSADGFPMPYPSKLVLEDSRPVAGKAAVPPASAAERPGSPGNATLHAAPARRLHHGHSVKTIRPACRTFINFPNDREFLPLEIPGLWGKTYAKLFWYLRNRKPEAFVRARHLYYAPIRWKAEPVQTEACCELTLATGEWDAANRRYSKLNVLRVDWSGWSRSRRQALLREVAAAREEAVEAARQDGDIKGWLFFVATQDAGDPALFHLDDHRFICCLAARLSWPAREPAAAIV